MASVPDIRRNQREYTLSKYFSKNRNTDLFNFLHPINQNKIFFRVKIVSYDFSEIGNFFIMFFAVKVSTQILGELKNSVKSIQIFNIFSPVKWFAKFCGDQNFVSPELCTNFAGEIFRVEIFFFVNVREIFYTSAKK